ncbi:MAG: glycosyltransferase family 2 protein [Caulobacteraceae bacterium]
MILTFNEERNLPACLAALGPLDDVHVVDSGSTDRTVAIAEQAGAKVRRRPFDDFASQRNFGLDHCEFRHEWILHLDADEVLTENIRREIEALPETGPFDGYRVASMTMFFGRWLRRSGMYPTYQVRLGRRDRLRFRQIGHGQRETLPPEEIGTLREAYLHYSFSAGLASWFAKHVRYAADEADLCLRLRLGRSEDDARSSRRQRDKALSYRLPLFLRPVFRFVYVLILRGGVREGWRGLLYASMLSVYEAMIAVLAYERLLIGRGLSNSPPSGIAENVRR